MYRYLSPCSYTAMLVKEVGVERGWGWGVGGGGAWVGRGWGVGGAGGGGSLPSITSDLCKRHFAIKMNGVSCRGWVRDTTC